MRNAALPGVLMVITVALSFGHTFTARMTYTPGSAWAETFSPMEGVSPSLPIHSRSCRAACGRRPPSSLLSFMASEARTIVSET